MSECAAPLTLALALGFAPPATRPSPHLPPVGGPLPGGTGKTSQSIMDAFGGLKFIVKSCRIFDLRHAVSYNVRGPHPP